MLTDITIKNYTIVDSLHLTLQPGLSTLSGETGAGKSILVGAVSLSLGARADIQAIRQGAQRCDISLSFDLKNNPDATRWLEEHDLSDENNCIIHRSISADGRSKSRINARPCPQSIVRELSSHLLTIHGQHQHQDLLKRNTQGKKLDDYANNAALLNTIQTQYQQWHEKNATLSALKKQALGRDEQLALLRYQRQELEDLTLKKGEWEQLHADHQLCHQAKQLITNLNQAIDLTLENERACAMTLLHQAIEQVNAVKTNDPQLTTINTLLSSAAIHLQEAGDELNHYRNNLDLSPERLAHIEARLTLLHDAARKHRVNPEDLIDIEASLAQKIKTLENIETHMTELEINLEKILKDYKKIARKLTEKRKKASAAINKAITQFMQTLGMKGGYFEVKLEPISQAISMQGDEKVHFHISTNPGQPLQPMHKVVSGGELSRISLALQVLISTKENTSSFIFDEVDVGIGGETAEMVGKLLRELGEKAQVFCITHLAQVASQGHHHFKVEKTSTNTTTSTRILPLNKTERVKEIARMLSGSKITPETLQHAEQMVL